jgi:basic membrane protein A
MKMGKFGEQWILRSIVARAGIGVFGLSIVACSASSVNDAQDTTQCADAKSVCIGLVIESGSVDDGAFHAAAWDGVQEAALTAGATAEFLESTDPLTYAQNIQDFAERGFDVIVTTGVSAPLITRDAALRYPESHFIGVSQDMSNGPENATGLVFRDDQAGYAAGYLAGLMTKTGVVGAVLGSEEVVPLKRFGEGYRLGVLDARPDATVLMNYNNANPDSFNDPAWGGATARQQIAQGADIIFGAGGTTGIGAMVAVAELPGAGSSLYCIGIDVDQYESVPEARPCLLTSAEKKIAQGISEITKLVIEGSQVPSNFLGETGLAPYHDLDDRVSEDVKQRVEGVIQKLRDGRLLN